jgi:AraC-like DNA-binding protein
MQELLEIHRNNFWNGTTNLDIFRERPCHIEGGFIFLCMKGEAVIATGIQEYHVVKNSTAMFLSGMTFFLRSSSQDFNVRMFTFSEKLYGEVVLRLPPSFSQYMNEVSVYKHPDDSSILKNVEIFMDMAGLVYGEKESKYADTMQRNFLQTYMMYVLENVQPFLNHATSKYTRRQRLFHRFISLLYTHCRQHHDIAFYADRLCITPRYLYDITFECSPGLSPKQFIDKQLILEIKTLLYSSDLTITEMSFQLNLPDQSYLCRYFKRHTGISPTEFRNRIKHNR